MCRVVATFSERRSIVAESLPIDRQRGAVSEPFEMIAARDAADEVELIAETEPVVGQKCVGALRSDGEEKFVVFAAGYGGFEGGVPLRGSSRSRRAKTSARMTVSAVSVRIRSCSHQPPRA